MVAEVRTGFTRAQDDFLKALYQLGGDGGPVSTGELAQRLGVSSASVSEMVGRLTAQGLVSYDRYRGQRLTDRGRIAALELVRHHRLLEMFLVQVLGFSWDEVHAEAERLEHVISERMEERIYEILGRPDLDPHGHAIPGRDGSVRAVADRPLSSCQPGETVVIRAVSDDDADRLRELERRGLKPGIRLEVLEGTEYESPIEARTGERRLSIPLGLAREIFIEELRS
ncbi:MAG: metal-dependent transcriptional regulator [Acidimicrobiales bacterium]